MNEGLIPNWKKRKTNILHNAPEWAKSMPYQVKSIAMRDAINAMWNALKVTQKTGELHEVGFRCRKGGQNIYVPRQLVKSNGFYTRLMGKMKTAEPIPEPKGDCRVVLCNGEYFLTIPIDVMNQYVDNQDMLAGIDPGVRSFATIYSAKMVGKIGGGDFNRIYRLCRILDGLISLAAKGKCNAKRRKNLRRAQARVRIRIKNLINELHHKVALFLCKTFKYIALPPFRTSEMVQKLHSKTARNMLTFAHYRFKMFLKHKAKQYGCIVLDQDEDYTSRTCGHNGITTKVGSRKVFKCRVCHRTLDRDYNGARNIYIRALRDSACNCREAITECGDIIHF